MNIKPRLFFNWQVALLAGLVKNIASVVFCCSVLLRHKQYLLQANNSLTRQTVRMRYPDNMARQSKPPPHYV
jgi:hypothetical protein